jgi:transcription elongation factor Elf1
MAPTPRLSLNDDFAAHLNCPICGKASLIVHHTASLPDYVSCRSCGSAFVVEADGDRVLYGKINDQYPRAQQFALKQWVMLEAVERRASEEGA